MGGGEGGDNSLVTDLRADEQTGEGRPGRAGGRTGAALVGWTDERPGRTGTTPGGRAGSRRTLVDGRSNAALDERAYGLETAGRAGGRRHDGRRPRTNSTVRIIGCGW